MLIEAASQVSQVPAGEITTEAGMIHHKASGKKAGYGELASLAASLTVPEEVGLREISDFKTIGKSKKNVEGLNIVTGNLLLRWIIDRMEC